MPISYWGIRPLCLVRFPVSRGSLIFLFPSLGEKGGGRGGGMQSEEDLNVEARRGKMIPPMRCDIPSFMMLKLTHAISTLI